MYSVMTESGAILCVPRGKLRRNGTITIGDYVEITRTEERGVIEKVRERKNRLVRPYIANIDMIVIVIAPIPKPDYTLIDKMLINCIAVGVEALLCVNKNDIADSAFLDRVRKAYKGLVHVTEASAKNRTGCAELLDKIRGKYVCLSGQSAVGKSSLINVLLGRDECEVGELSKIGRGKNCTRSIEIIDIGDNTRVADTCGFSMLELTEVRAEELHCYYTEFDVYADRCKYRGCAHIDEPSCAVKRALENGEISADRYARYVKLYKLLSEKERKKYE